MTLIDGLGYLASALVLLTFCMGTMLSLRAAAICSNLAFIGYGLSADIYPVLILHLILLPVNVLLLIQMITLLRKAKLAAATDLSPGWLQPFMRARKFRAGDTIFRKGDHADLLYQIVSGEVRLPEIEQRLGAGDLFGEIGLFSLARRDRGNRCRTAVHQRRRAEEAVRAQPGTVAVLPAADGHSNVGERRAGGMSDRIDRGQGPAYSALKTPPPVRHG